jgi:hypothetical protein
MEVVFVRSTRPAAVVTWVYAAGFGVPAVPVAVFVSRNGRLPSFLGLFDMYAGPWSQSLIGTDNDAFISLLIVFLVLNVLVAGAAWLLWRGSTTGAVLGLVSIPVEAVFWFGFALPIPWILAAVRVALIAAGWRSLRGHVPDRPPAQRNWLSKMLRGRGHPG